MFRRKKSEPPKVQPQLPSKMFLENGAVDLLEQIRRDHKDNIKLCSDLIAMRNWAERAKADMLKDAMEWADQFDFWCAKINESLARFQTETESAQEPLQLQSAVSNGAITDQSSGEPRPIGFLADRGKP